MPVRHHARHTEFFFIGDHPALDFLNTRPVLNERPAELLVGLPSLLRWFVRAGLIDGAAAEEIGSRWRNHSAAARAFSRSLSFRERLRSAIFTVESTGRVPRVMIDEVNQLLKSHPVSFRLVRAGRRLAKTTYFPTRTPDDLLGILANLVADLFSEVEPRRIRKCKACVLHFRDRTKNGTRRWCSMQVCGNRAKVAAYARRRRRREQSDTQSR